MSQPSFERFDYLLRTNKHIERKLVFDVLYSVSQSLDLSGSWYLGFGSMWFGDFRLAHRLLGIETLVSIEKAPYAARAEFNRPFSGIQVKAGESEDVIRDLDTNVWNTPVVAWLDYDGALSTSIVSDMKRILSSAALNSVVAVTVNAARPTYRARNVAGPKSRSHLSIGAVEAFLGKKSISPRFEPVQVPGEPPADVSEGNFPEFLADALLSYMQHEVAKSGRVGPKIEGGEKRELLRFLPLYRLHHQDGADMVTVGGAIVTDSSAQAWTSALSRNPILADAVGVPQFTSLNLVPITVKEKISLDACMPAPADEDAFTARVVASGLKLDESEVSKYRKFYRHFPVFVETSV